MIISKVMVTYEKVNSMLDSSGGRFTCFCLLACLFQMRVLFFRVLICPRLLVGTDWVWEKVGERTGRDGAASLHKVSGRKVFAFDIGRPFS